MKGHIIVCTALLGLSAAGTDASPGLQPSPLALPIVVAGGSEFTPAPAPTTFEVRFRPRRPHPTYHEPVYGPRPETFTQFHVGMLHVDDTSSPGILFGLRGGVAVDPHVQIGGQFEWRHQTQDNTQLISREVGPGGTVITVQQDLARSSSDLVPLMGMLQIGGRRGQFMPYFGVAGGVEWLHLSAQNFHTGEEFEGHFVGFGWQTWGGIALPLSGRVRVNAEAFYNGSELSRDIYDNVTGLTLRETVDMSGPGARFGLAWGF